jgi:hypothetical protein
MNMQRLFIIAAALALFTQPLPASADVTPEQFVKLAQAYQGGYLQLLAASALQVYSTTGILATEFSEGKRTGVDAADALADTTLLHGVAYSSLLEVQKATPKEDAKATAQIGRLAAALVAEQKLLGALQDVFSNPTDKNAQRVQTAKENVGKLLDKLAE